MRRRGNAREGVAVLMNERVWMCVKEIRNRFREAVFRWERKCVGQRGLGKE